MQFDSQKKNTEASDSESNKHAAFKDPVQLAQLLLDHWKLIVGSVIVTVVAAIIYLSLATPTYRANARLEIFQDSRLAIKESGFDRMERRINRHVLMMQSKTLRKEVVQKLKPDWSDEVDQLVLKTDISPVRASNGTMLDIFVEGPNPAYAEAYLEEMIKQYMQLREAELELANSTALSGLRNEEQLVLSELEAAKVDLHKFSEENEVFLSQEKEEMDAVFINQLLSRLKTIRLERTMLENQYADIVNADLATIKEALELSRGLRPGVTTIPQNNASTNSGDSSASSGLILSGMAITAESGRDALLDWEQQEETLAILQNNYDEKLSVFKETHPKMLELQSEIVSLEKNLSKKAELALRRFQARFDALKLQEQGIESVVNSWERDEPLTIERKNEYILLETKVQHLERKYDAVYRRVLENSGRSDSLSIRTVHEPLASNRPVSPKSAQAFIVAVAMGLCLSIGGILAREFFKPETLDVDYVEHHFNIPCLISIPNWKDVLDSSDYDPVTDRIVVKKGTNPIATETYRGLRYKLDSIFDGKSKFSLTVTSPKRNDGKTFNTANLAVPYTWDGKRVLLIDGDIRRANLTETLLGRKDIAGWTKWLHNPKTNVNDLITRVEETELDLLPAGIYDDSIPERVKQRSVKDLISHLHQQYDVIIFDSAPSNVVVETNEICRATDGVLVLADANTKQAEMASTLRNLKNTNLIGFCLNNAVIKGDSYGYGYGYGYEPANRKEKVAVVGS